MNFLTKFSLKNSVAVFIFSFLIILTGIYSFQQLKVDLLPNIEFPQLSVEIIYPGASPQDISEQVTSNLEDELKNLEGLSKMSSSSFETISFISLEFPFGTNLDDAETKIDNIVKNSKLPEKVSVKVNRFSMGTFPIYNISMFAKGDGNLQEILEDEMIPDLNKIEGINSVSVGGSNHETLQITVDRMKAQQNGLSLNDIKNQINEKYFAFPAGSITANEIVLPVRIEEKLGTMEALKSLPLKSSMPSGLPSGKPPGMPSGIPSGMPPMGQTDTLAPAPLLLKDIAKVEVVSEKPEYTRYNQRDSLSVAITKKQDANTVEVADEVNKVLDKYEDKVEYVIGMDSATSVKKSIDDLIREGLLGALFASIAVLLFLRNFRATFIAIISIPLSILISAIFLNQLDITLNVMTLGGMAVAVGRVVDDSIVVIENIFRRIRKDKTGISNELLQESTKEILSAITYSTVTTAVVFLPLGFVGGITGEFFLPFALTVVFSLLASLIVAVTIVPILARFAFAKVPAEEKEGWLQTTYAKLIEKSLNHKLLIILLSIGMLLGSVALVPALGFTFIPNEEQKLLMATVELPSASSIEKTNQVSLAIEEMFAEQKEIKDVTTAVGTRDYMTGMKKRNQANYFINLKEDADVEKSIKAIEKNINETAKPLSAGLKISVMEMSSGGPPSNNTVDFDLYSNDLQKLQEASVSIEQYLMKQKNLKYISNNFSNKQKQVIVEIDPQKASDLGISAYQILGIISDATTPLTIGDLKLDGKQQVVQLSYNKEAESIEELQALQVFGKQGPVPLTAVAKVAEVENFTSIQKLNGKIYARVSGTITSDNIQEVTDKITSGVKDEIKLPSGVKLSVGGGSEDTMDTFIDLIMAMIIAVGLVYLTLLIAFGKARIPFIILSSLVFVPIGAFVSLFIMGEPLSVSVMIGILMLIGIVTTNAIVLVDRINQNREVKKLPIRTSLIEAGKTRIRPILMTAFATVAALLPLAFTKASGTLISKGLAITVIGGMTTSTLLTLILVPILYEVFFFRTVRLEKGLKSTK